MDYATLEPLQHGTPEKNIDFYNHMPMPSLYVPSICEGFIAHWHPEHEFIYVYQGPVNFIINNKPYCVQTNEAIYINKNTIHASVEPTVPNYQYVCVTFGEPFIFSSTLDVLYQEYFLPLYVKHRPFPTHIKNDGIWQQKVLPLLKQLCDSGLKKPDGCELEWRILLLQIFHVAYTYRAVIPQDSSLEAETNITATQSAISAIQNHYADTISVSQLAQSIGFTTEYFCRTFKSVTGKTPVEYINSYRLQKAEHMLTHTTDRITDIAASCGFNDINYFSRYFKKIHNISPSQYRKVVS